MRSPSSLAGRVGVLAAALAGAFTLLPSSSADARLNGHPGSTGRPNGGTCNRCHSPQTYEGLTILPPSEYRRDCYQEVNEGYQLTNSFYVLPYSSSNLNELRTEIPIKVVLDEPPAAEPGAEQVGISCPTEGQVLPAVECESPDDCPAGADLCKDYGATVTEVEVYGLPGDCVSGSEQDDIEAACGEEGALCAGDACARRVTRDVNSCGQTLPECQSPNWAGFAMEVTGISVENQQPVLKAGDGETGVKQAGATADEAGSRLEVNHSEPREFAEGTASWTLSLQTPRYTEGNPVQQATLYASANACNHNFQADVGDVTAIGQLPIYFQLPGGGHTGPECLEGPVCKPGQVIDGELQCVCPNGYALGDSDGDGKETCEAAGLCSHTAAGSGAGLGAGFAVLGLGLFLRRRRRAQA